MDEKHKVFTFFGGAILIAFLWPEVLDISQKWLSPSLTNEIISIIIFVICFIFNLLIKDQSQYFSAARHPLYVRIFVIFFFLLGLASILDASPGEVPVERGWRAFFYIISLWGAALISTDLVRAIYFKFTKRVRK